MTTSTDTLIQYFQQLLNSNFESYMHNMVQKSDVNTLTSHQRDIIIEQFKNSFEESTKKKFENIIWNFIEVHEGPVLCTRIQVKEIL